VANNVVRVVHNGNPPKLRSGGWILDATPYVDVPQPPPNPPRHVVMRNAFFYRVTSVTDVNANTTDYEVQTPFRGFPPPVVAGSPPPWAGTVVVLEGVVEVFERGSGPRP
jgi:hypothetical protein